MTQSHTNRQSYLYGAAVLTAAAVLVKAVGMLFKIPLTALIGGVGMGDFSIAYDIFRPLNALATAGLPVAVSKLVSESAALGRYRDVRRILRLSGGLFFFTGTAGFAVMFLGAGRLARALNSSDSALCIAALAPALFFCCMMSALRGYYQGLGNMLPTALSQIFEAVVKLGAGLWLGSLFLSLAENPAAAPSWIWPLLQTGAAPGTLGAVGAVLGVSLSTAAGTLFLAVRHFLRGDGLGAAALWAAPPPRAAGDTLKALLLIAVPVCLSSLAVHLTTLVDLASIMNRLSLALRRDSGVVLAMHEGFIPPGLPLSQLPKYLYGCYSGIAVNLFNLIPSLTTALGVSILPALSGAFALGDKKAMKRNIESALRVSALLVLPAALGLMSLAKPITLLLYGARPMEAALAAPLVRALGPAVVFVSLATPLGAMLQAVGRVSVPLRLMVLGGGIKLGVNFLLVGLPALNIKAAPAGTVLCYAFIVVCEFSALSRAVEEKISCLSVFGKPLLGGVICALGARFAFFLLQPVLFFQAAVILSIAVGGFFYLFALLFTRAIKRDDLIMLPMGEKVAKILEKHSLIG